MAHNLGTRAVLSDKISSASSGLFSKVGSTVKNLSKPDPSLATPVNYKVVHHLGIFVRDSRREGAEKLHRLNQGDVVTVVERSGRHARVISPVEGWVFTETKQGAPILKRCIRQDKRSQNEAIEQCFEQRRFNQQLQNQRGADYRNVNLDITTKSRDVSRSDEESGDDRGRTDPSRRRRDDSENRGPVVPKLAAPGSAVGPVVLAPPPCLSSKAAAQTAQAHVADTSSGSADSLGFDLLSLDDSALPATKPNASTGTPFDPSGGAADNWANFQNAPPAAVQGPMRPGCGFGFDPNASAQTQCQPFATSAWPGMAPGPQSWNPMQQQAVQGQQQLLQQQLQYQQQQQQLQLQQQQQAAKTMAAASFQLGASGGSFGGFAQGSPAANWAPSFGG